MNNQYGRLWILVFGAVMIATLCVVHNYGFALPSERGRRLAAIWFACLAMYGWAIAWIMFISNGSMRSRLRAVTIFLFVSALIGLSAIRSVIFNGVSAAPQIEWRWQSNGHGLEQYKREDRR